MEVSASSFFGCYYLYCVGSIICSVNFTLQHKPVGFAVPPVLPVLPCLVAFFTPFVARDTGSCFVLFWTVLSLVVFVPAMSAYGVLALAVLGHMSWLLLQRGITRKSFVETERGDRFFPSGWPRFVFLGIPPPHGERSPCPSALF